MLLFGCHVNKVASPADTSNHSNPSELTPRTVHLDEASYAFQELQTSKLAKRTLPFIVEASGQLQANANAVTRISAPVSGKVTTISCSLGEMVKPGATLASVSSQEIGTLITDLFKTETEISSDLSRDVLEIEYQLRQVQAELLLCQKQYERAKLLLTEKITAVSAVEALQTELDKHNLSIDALKDKKTSLERVAAEKRQLARQAVKSKLLLLGMPGQTIDRILSARTVVDEIPIVTPHSGFVLERNVNIGELVDPSGTLFVVDDIDTLWLVADIFEQDIKYVESGQTIEFTVDSYPHEHFSGTLDFVAGTINPETRTLAVRALIKNPRLKLKPKMFARMKILAGKHEVLAIPKCAVQNAGSDKVVYVKIGTNLFEQRKISVGEDYEDYAEVLSGVRQGESVVTKGSFDLHSQMLKCTR